jgi:hypothetical protein
MARLESDHGRLLVSFQFNGVRCREYLGLDDTRDDRRTGARTVNEIECELKAGKFDYAARFPESRRLERFGIKPQAQVPSLTPAEEKPEVPSLGKFAEAWLEERRAVLTLATAYDYDRLIKALLLSSQLAHKRIGEVNDGDPSLHGRGVPPKDSQRTAGRTSADQHDHRAIANDLRDRQAPQAGSRRPDAVRPESSRTEGRG